MHKIPALNGHSIPVMRVGALALAFAELEPLTVSTVVVTKLA